MKKQIIVLFEVTIKKDHANEYMKLVGDLKAILAEAEGFIRAEHFFSLANEGRLLSLTVWESEESVEQWRNLELHRLSQRQGRNAIFENYTIAVISPIRIYSDRNRAETPKDSNERFYGQRHRETGE